MEITLEQKQQLNTWATQRDAILLEIAAVKGEKEILVKETIALGESRTEIETQINIAKGRLQEILVKEDEFKDKISKSVADLMVQQTSLQTNISSEEKYLEGLVSQKILLTETLTIISQEHDKSAERALVIKEIMDHVVKISDRNILDVETFIIALKKSIQEIIDANKDSAQKTKIVVDKLPGIFLSLQKPEIIKRVTRQK